MIIELLLDAFYNIFSLLFAFELPLLPDSIYGYIDTAFEYIVAGGGILANYTPLPYLMTLFALLLAIDAGILIYHFVMWIIRKIPMASVS